MMVLWPLMGRGLSLEYRGRIADPLWKTALDVIFFASSTLLALTFGLAVATSSTACR